MTFYFILWWSCLSLCSRQLASEVWWLQCQERLGLGAGLRAWGAGVGHAALHSRKEDKRGFASQLAKPDCSMPFPRLFFSLHLPAIHFLTPLFQAVKQFPPWLWNNMMMSQGIFCKVGIISQSIFIYSELWDVICMHSNMHISVFFRESSVKSYLHICCF